MSVEGWMPRRWNEELAGLVWLPRLLDKGRRRLEGERRGQDLMDGYLFGDFDYADGKLLKFLRTDDARVLKLLSESDEDEAVAKTLIAESGRSVDEVQAWNKGFSTVNALFIAMWDADEGRRAPGFGTALLRFVYNFALMPPVYLTFRIAQGFRRLKRP